MTPQELKGITAQMMKSGAMRDALALPVLGEWTKGLAFHDAGQAEAIGRVLVGAIHRHLANHKVAYVFREKMKKRDKLVLATASLAGAKLEFFTGFDFCIDINWSQYRFASPEQKVALIDHELCHFGVEDTDKGFKCVTLSHDVEEFNAIVTRWGLWKPDVKNFAQVCAEQTELFEATTKA